MACGSDGVVVWNGDKAGSNRGYLMVDAHAALAPPPARPSEHELAAPRIRAALAERPEGWLCHELAQHLGLDSYRVGQELSSLDRSGIVRSDRLDEPVWTGFRWGTIYLTPLTG